MIDLSEALPECRLKLNNDGLVENAGKISIDPGQPWGRGIVSDIKRTLGLNWRKEMTNLNMKTAAITLLIFISVISPTLTFGAVYGKVTKNRIGAIEVLLGTSWVGIAHALLGGMPICIIGATGPLLAFAVVIFNMSESLGVPFLTFNAWVSVWLLFFMVLAGFFDLGRLFSLLTRFTDEISAFLVVSIFVMDAIGDPFSGVGLLRFLDPNHESHESQEDNPDYNYLAAGFFSVILGLGTTGVIFFFRSFKYSSFFCNDGVRSSIHDFSVTLSVIGWTLVKQLIFDEVETETLKVPDRFEPSFACCDSSCKTFFPDDCPELSEAAGTRPWIVDLTDLNGKAYVPFVAAGPAVLAFILIFLDNGFAWHLIYHKRNQLKHGPAYNYDLCWSGIINCVNGLLGFPWLLAITITSVIHLQGLTERNKDGKILSIQETRLTGFLAHVLMALSILALDVLRLIPLPVLYGVFLFMGLSVLPRIQFWDRLLLFLQQPSKYPKTVYTRYIEKARVHKYTLLQLLFFLSVFVVLNVEVIAIAFPLMTLMGIPARLYFLPRIFSCWELLLLDGDDEEIQEWIEAKEESVQAEMEPSQHRDSTGDRLASIEQVRQRSLEGAKDRVDESQPMKYGEP